MLEREGEEILDFLSEVWRTMNAACDEGLSRRGVLPGGLKVERKAQYLFHQKHIDESPETREDRIVCAYAFAISEQNADGGVIVTRAHLRGLQRAAQRFALHAGAARAYRSSAFCARWPWRG